MNGPPACRHPALALTFWMDDYDYRQRIVMTPGVRSGKPCVRGTRVTVYDVFGYLAADMSQQEVLDDFPYLTAEDLRACFAAAAAGRRTAFASA